VLWWCLCAGLVKQGQPTHRRPLTHARTHVNPRTCRLVAATRSQRVAACCCKCCCCCCCCCMCVLCAAWLLRGGVQRGGLRLVGDGCAPDNCPVMVAAHICPLQSCNRGSGKQGVTMM
jgi:hypothetical protein